MTNIPEPKPASGADHTGKTFADVFYCILTDWRKLLSFFFLLAGLAGILFLASSIIINKFRVESVSEIDLSSGKILFQTTVGGKKEISVAIIHPQGWQDTDIPVKKGDRIKITAGGKVTVDLAGIVETVNKRKELEKKYEKAVPLRRASEDMKDIPESYYSEPEKESLKFNRGWVGPNGYEESFTKQSFRARHKLKILPDKNLGMLLGAVNISGQLPEKSQAFPIGLGVNDFVVPADGVLWFTVNDDINNDTAIRDLFFGDNIGFFWVKVEVDRTRSAP